MLRISENSIQELVKICCIWYEILAKSFAILLIQVEEAKLNTHMLVHFHYSRIYIYNTHNTHYIACPV